MGQAMELGDLCFRLIDLWSRPEHAEELQARRKAFFERTGVVKTDDACFEQRTRLFWDDTCADASRPAWLDERSPEERAWLVVLGRAHRGLFVRKPGPELCVVDVWCGAELFIHPMTDDGVRLALDNATGLFDGRVVRNPDGTCLQLLPGAFFHPPDATPAITEVIRGARELAWSASKTFDALLRMELQLHRLSRVKAAFAYRLASTSADLQPYGNH